MQLNLGKGGIGLVPESYMEELYLEQVLGLFKEGDTARATRQSGGGKDAWGYLEIVAALPQKARGEQ